MKITDNCPICQSKCLKVISRDHYCKPDNVLMSDLTEIDYPYEIRRLSILFNTVLKEKTKLESSVSLCKDCGFIFLNPRFTESQRNLFYETLVEHKLRGTNAKIDPAQKTEERSERIYNLIMKHSTFGENSRILDFGGMQGYNLIHFVKNNHTCHLLDYVKTKKPEGVEYIGSEFPPDTKVSYDVILVSHVLEHVTEPLEIMKDIKKHLKPEGILFIEVPLGSKNEWHIISEPTTHINFFSEESLYNLITLVQYDVIFISTDNLWVTHSSSECVTAICVNRKPNNKIEPLKTSQQFESKNSLIKKIRWLSKSPFKNTIRAIQKRLP